MLDDVIGLLTKRGVKMAGYWPNMQKKEWGQYPAFLTEQAWSIKDLCVLYGIKQHQKIDKFSLQDKLSIPSEQDYKLLFLHLARTRS